MQVKWQATMMDCDACGYEWAAVHPVVAEYLECPVCHHMTPAPYIEETKAMHYRNGREAKNGDKVIQLSMDEKGSVVAAGVLYNATPGNDYCNGNIAPIQQQVTGACICDCIHADDLAEILAEKGLNKRSAGK